jgi:acetylornithine/succinyldiaminopimelate/putrescine aminotransferase
MTSLRAPRSGARPFGAAGRGAARAATGKRKILVASKAYHGSSPWCTPSPAGVTAEDRAHLIAFTYNDIASLEAAADAAGPDLAGVMVSAFKHDIGIDLELPTREFAQRVRALCTAKGAARVLSLRAARCGASRLRSGRAAAHARRGARRHPSATPPAAGSRWACGPT